MSIYVNNTFRIKRSLDQQEAMQKIISAKIFDGYKDVIMISAIVGYLQNQFVPITKNGSDGVLMQFFSPRDYDIMDLLAYARTKSQTILKSDEKYDILSSYANGGFPILVNKLGIDLSKDISADDARKAQQRYYMLLLSGDFEPDIDISDTDLLN